MVVTICMRRQFAAAHWLPLMPDGHKCKTLHGHTYSVEVRLSGEPNERGIIVDYDELDAAWERHVKPLVDHKTLNDTPGLENPTTEVLAPFLLARFAALFAQVSSVRVYESSSTWCEATR